MYRSAVDSTKIPQVTKGTHTEHECWFKMFLENMTCFF